MRDRRLINISARSSKARAVWPSTRAMSNAVRFGGAKASIRAASKLLASAAKCCSFPGATLRREPKFLLVLQGIGQSDLLLGGQGDVGDTDEGTLFFTRVSPTRFRGAPQVVIELGAAELRPERVRRGVGPHAILPQGALERVWGSLSA